MPNILELEPFIHQVATFVGEEERHADGRDADSEITKEASGQRIKEMPDQGRSNWVIGKEGGRIKRALHWNKDFDMSQT